MTTSLIKNPTRINLKAHVRAELQREIGSRCPFCPSEDVGHFEVHHVDCDRSNTIPENLLMLCRQCHSKFTKGEWLPEEAKQKKSELLADVDYLLFNSDKDIFDYKCFNFRNDNGRIPEDNSNGSQVNVFVKDRYHFIVTLKHDNRKWIGELILQQKDYGILFFRYQGENEFEFGRRECYLKQNKTVNLREDIIYIKPLTDLKDYGNELVKRITYIQ